MHDPRIAKLARVLVRHSLALREGDLFLLSSPTAAEPLVREVYREALLVGAHPLLRISIEGVENILYQHATDEQLRYLPDLALQEIEQIDAMLSISAAENTKRLMRVAPQKLATRRQATQEIQQRLVRRIAAGTVRWTSTLFPTQA